MLVTDKRISVPLTLALGIEILVRPVCKTYFINQQGSEGITLTLRRIRITIVAVEKR